MSDTEVNIPLLRKAVEWVEVEAAKPKTQREWHQGSWRWSADVRSQAYDKNCGTAYCIAGYVCYLAGEEWATASEVRLQGGSTVPIRAAELLGINYEPGRAGYGHLFSGGNDAATVRSIAEDLAGERL